MSQFPTNITPEKYLKLLPVVQPQINLDCTQLQAKINDLTLELTSQNKRLEDYNANRQASLKIDIDRLSSREDIFKLTPFDKGLMELGIDAKAETGARFNIESAIKAIKENLFTLQEEYNQKCGESGFSPKLFNKKENTLPKTDSTKQLIYVGLGIVAILIVTKLISKIG